MSENKESDSGTQWPAILYDQAAKVSTESLEIIARETNEYTEHLAFLEFLKAVIAMQGELQTIKEDAAIVVNGQLRSKYATLEGIIGVLRPILFKHGFAVWWKIKTTVSTIETRCCLAHIGGHVEVGELMTLPLDATGSKNVVQQLGSSKSYAKRYTLQAMIPIVTTGEDDDASTATIEWVSEEQVANIRALIEEVGANEAGFVKHMKAKSVERIRASEYDRAIAALETKRKK